MNTTAEPPPLYTMTELAAYLRVNVKTIQRWLKQDMPALNVGGPIRPDWRFDLEDVRGWLRRRDAARSGLLESGHE